MVNKPFEVPIHPPAKKILPYEEESNSIISLLRNQFFTFMKKIQENHYKTTDEDKMDEMTSKRFAMRTYVGTKYLREVNLKPLK